MNQLIRFLLGRTRAAEEEARGDQDSVHQEEDEDMEDGQEDQEEEQW